VTPETNPDYYDLIRAFERQDGLRRAGQHVVQRPRRADRLHARGRVPLLHADAHRLPGAGPFLLDKAMQPEWKEEGDWRDEFQLD
jgi:carbamoyltransferase